MRKSKFTEEQIAFALKQAELGTPVAEVFRKMGITENTFYIWKRKYGGLGPSGLKRLKQLEEENRTLKQLVAGLSLDKAMLQDVVSKSSKARQAALSGGASAQRLPCQRTTGLPSHLHGLDLLA